MNAEVCAAVIDPLLLTIIHDAGLDLSYILKPHRETEIPILTVEFAGLDVPCLLARNAELLLAFEHIAAKALRLESEHHDLISFDAGGYKTRRERALQQAAKKASQEVRKSGRPFHFPPMNSRERRLLHLALAPYGLHAASEAEGALRHIVLHASARDSLSGK